MTMSKSQNAITEACRAGYQAGKSAVNPHLFSSNVWLAWEAGRWLHDACRLEMGGARHALP